MIFAKNSCLLWYIETCTKAGPLSPPLSHWLVFQCRWCPLIKFLPTSCCVPLSSSLHLVVPLLQLLQRMNLMMIAVTRLQPKNDWLFFRSSNATWNVSSRWLNNTRHRIHLLLSFVSLSDRAILDQEEEPLVQKMPRFEMFSPSWVLHTFLQSCRKTV